MLSASLVDRQLLYSATLKESVIFAVISLVTVVRSSAVACSRMAKTTEIFAALFMPQALLYPPWQEVFWSLHRSYCASMKCAWNSVQVFSCFDLAHQVHQSSLNCPVSLTRPYAMHKTCPSVMGLPAMVAYSMHLLSLVERLSSGLSGWKIYHILVSLNKRSVAKILAW